MIHDPKEGSVWLKYQFFQAGISPYEFRKCRVKDIKEIMEIKGAIDERAMREQKVKNMQTQMKY